MGGLNKYRLLDRFYVPLDRRNLRRTRNLRFIPLEADRRGGKTSYAEWAHVIGIFQTLMCLHLPRRADNQILDIGCGTGLIGIAAEPFILEGGKYTGIDVGKEDIDFCRRHYPASQFEFVHLDIANPEYAPGQNCTRTSWPLPDNSYDLGVALSVWTHLNEEDALFYFKELRRVLKPGAKAIVTFFLLDDVYEASVKQRGSGKSRFHNTSPDRWIFDQPSSESGNWRHPKWAPVPETAIGVTPRGFESLAQTSGLRAVENHPGNWKERPGIFFQDVIVFQKD